MLTPEQTQDLIDWAGSQTAAAHIVGVGKSTIGRWVDPEKERRASQRRRRDPEYRAREMARKKTKDYLRKRRASDRRYREANRERINERERARLRTPEVRARRYKKIRAKLDAGLCVVCGRPAVSVRYCAEHLDSHRENQAWYKLANPRFDY